jgi:hypothetical protein
MTGSAGVLTFDTASFFYFILILRGYIVTQ